jgi:hypothetical protein
MSGKNEKKSMTDFAGRVRVNRAPSWILKAAATREVSLIEFPMVLRNAL